MNYLKWISFAIFLCIGTIVITAIGNLIFDAPYSYFVVMPVAAVFGYFITRPLMKFLKII